MIRIHQLYKRFGSLTVLNGIDLAIDRPGVHMIIGPNGSGKTTLIKSILGMVIPDQGTIQFDGRVVNGKWEYRRCISYLPQIAHFPDNLSARELVNFIRQVRLGAQDPRPLVQLLDLTTHMDKKIKHLSGGTLQKLNILLAFMYDSPVFILDEPTTGLDPLSLFRLKERIRMHQAAKKYILITTHIINLVEEMADEIIFLLEGRIYFQGTPDALKAQSGEHHLERAIAKIIERRHVEGI